MGYHFHLFYHICEMGRRDKGSRVQGSWFRVARGECCPLIAYESSTRQLGVKSGGAAHKNKEVPRSFDSASRRRHRKHCPRSFLHSGQYHIGAASKRRLGATYFCFHTSFVYRSARKDFSTSLEMTIRAPDVSQSSVTSHLGLLIPSH